MTSKQRTDVRGTALALPTVPPRENARARRARQAGVTQAAGLLGQRIRALSLASVATLLGAQVLGLAQPVRAQTAATPRIAANALPTGLSQRSGTPVTYVGGTLNSTTGVTTATLRQADSTNILNWQSFDIGRAARLDIVQPSANAVLLNQVSGGAFQNKTLIEGVLNANGRVYLYNPNGIVFGKTATVNVNTLIASSLKFDEQRVLGGLLKAGDAPVLAADTSRLNADGSVMRPGDIVVEGDASGRATLRADTNGTLLLAGPRVSNAGQLLAPDGQVILAAGDKVYLAAPNTAETGTTLRGLVVEVANGDGSATAATSLAENAGPGQIDVGIGNATMVGYAVNQLGRVSATTSVNLNGSVFLLARDQAVMANNKAVATRSGELALGPDSVTEVATRSSTDETMAANGSFKRSLVRLNGLNISLQEGAKVVVPGGDVHVLAERRLAEDPGGALPNPATDTVRIDLAAGSLIDVSGSTGTTLAMESNVVEVDLRGTELADNLVLRESSLYGSKVRIDARKATGTTDATDGLAIANATGWLDQRQQTLGERNTKGGTVSLVASSAVLQRAGSQIKVDGGWVDYQAGYVNTTQLQLGNTLVDVAKAQAGVAYEAAVNLGNSSAHFEAGYRQGASAGTLLVSAPIVALQGGLSGQAQHGLYQRDVNASSTPLGGRLQLGLISDEVLKNDLGWYGRAADYGNRFRYDGQIVLGAGQRAATTLPAAGAAFDTTEAGQAAVVAGIHLDTDAWSQAGFTRLAAQTSRGIEVASDVALAPGGQLSLASRLRDFPFEGEANPPIDGRVRVGADVRVPSGSISLTGVAVEVADGVHLSAAGLWTNDRAATQPERDAAGNLVGDVASQGGSVSLSARDVRLGDNVAIDASAGAWMNSTGSTSKGNAGSIALEAKPLDGSVANVAASNLTLGNGLRLSAYGWGSGGTLKLRGRELVLGNVAAGSLNAGALNLPSSFFQQGGFRSYDIGAVRDLSVASDTGLQPRQANWVLASNAANLGSGALSSVANPQLLALASSGSTRAATHLSLSAGMEVPLVGLPAGRLSLAAGSRLELDPGATLNLSAAGDMAYHGAINAPAGNVNIVSSPWSGSPLLFFGATASIRADGSLARLYTGSDGSTTGEVLAGGNLRIGGKLQTSSLGVITQDNAAGAVVMANGAVFSVSGVTAAGTLNFRTSLGLSSVDRAASDGGSIDIRSADSLYLLGSFFGGGGDQAKGGSLSLALEADASVFDVLPALSATAALQTSRKLTAASHALSPPASAGQGLVIADRLNAGHFGTLRLRSRDALAFGLDKRSLTLQASSALVLDAPTLLSDRLTRATRQDDLLQTAIAELRAADRASGAERDLAELTEAATPIATTRLAAQRLDLARSSTLNLNAPYVQLGNSAVDQALYPSGGQASAEARSAMAGNASLNATADHIDLKGHVALQGFANTTLKAEQDIRFLGMAYVDPATDQGDGTQRGSLWVKGNLSLVSAQAYPTTLSDYLLAVAATSDENSGHLSFASSGATPGLVLSAGGSLTAYAPHIVQAGRLLAPHGQMALGNVDSAVDAILTSDLSYSAGSLTSVAGSGHVPFGTVSNGSVPTASQWATVLEDGSDVLITQTPNASATTHERSLPTKAIYSRAGSISTATGATLDLSGGGALFAYGFTPGRGGSKDVLDNSGTSTSGNKTYAILPGYSSQVAPVDANLGSDGLKPGDAVWLSGLGSLPAGYYTLLPAHDALLPGAYSITAVSGTRDMSAAANAVTADGSLLVAGRLADVGSGALAARSQGFLVSARSVVQRKSEFTLYDAGSYFSAKATTQDLTRPELPADGGHVVFDATAANANALRLNGSVRLGSATDAQGASLGQAGLADIAAPALEMGSGSSLGTPTAVGLSVAQLNAMGARSLAIGAVRSTEDDGSTTLTVRSAQINVANNASQPLSAPDLLLAATDRLSLSGQASIVSQGQTGTGLGDVTVQGPGAVLRASAQALPDLQRTGTGTGTNAALNTSGSLTLAPGASVTTTGSLSLDAGTRLTLDGSLLLGSGATLSLAAPNIQLGSSIPTAVLNTGALALDSSDLAHFGSLSSLTLNSYGTLIHSWGTATLGSSELQSLGLSGAGLQNHGGSLTLQAKQVQLAGASSALAASDSGHSGAFAVQAGQIALGSGNFLLHGFDDAALNASGQILATSGSGESGLLQADQHLSLRAAQISGRQGSTASFVAGGDLSLLSSGQALPAGTAPAFGASLQFSGVNVFSSTDIAAPSGQVALRATQALNMAGGAVSTAGQAVAFGDTAAYAPGGTLTLQGQDVTLAAGATLDVSAQGAAAGRLQMASANAVQLQGLLKGGATAAPGAAAGSSLPTQGEFQLNQSAAAEGFGALNAQLNDAGFTQARDFRFGQGDVLLAGSDKIVAQQVSIAADNGSIRLADQAVIDASGAKGGRIALYAAQATASGSGGRITVSDQAQLLAKGTAKVASDSNTASEAGSAGQGGSVLLAVANADGSAPTGLNGGASLHLDGGSIDVSGSSAARGGSITLRAPRLASGTDLAVASLATTRTGSDNTVLEGVQVYQASSISGTADSASNLNATASGQMYQDAARFGAQDAANAVRNRLGVSDASAAHVRAGIEVRSLASDASGALSVSVNEFATHAADRGWNLNAWRFDGQPVNLTLRAAGDLNIVGSLSDGFVKPTNTKLGMPDWALASDLSADLRLVAGADLSAARLTDTVAGQGDLRVDFAARTPYPADKSPIKVAGSSQLSAANPNAPVTKTDAPVALVRTGTGRIDVAAGHDVALGMAKFYVSAVNDETLETPLVFDSRNGDGYNVTLYGAALYTAGRAWAGDAPGFVAPTNALNTQYGATAGTKTAAVFARDGGEISLSAGHDVLGAQNLSSAWYYRNADGSAAIEADPPEPAVPAQPGTVAALARVVPQLVNQWLFRQGRSSTNAAGETVFETLADGKTTLNTAWWARPDYFGTGLGTLAGGDLTVRAGGDVSNLYASTASNADVPAVGAALVERGGGDLSVRAGGNIAGGQFYTQQGQMVLRADGSLTAGLLEPSASLGSGAGLNPIVALGHASVQVTAGGALALDTVYNPTLTEQGSANQRLGNGMSPLYTSSSAWNPADERASQRSSNAQFSNFLSYGDDSAVQLTALGGDLLLSANASGLASAGKNGSNGVANQLESLAPSAGFQRLYSLLPGTLRLAALGGDVVTGNSLVLSPSATGQLELLAQGSVAMNNLRASPISMLDAAPQSLSTLAAPRVMTAADVNILRGNSSALEAHAPSVLHAQDNAPVRIVAKTGDVLGDAEARNSLALPKALSVLAGRDIQDLGFTVQHTGASSVSTLQAGRDVLNSTLATPSVVSQVVGGAGRLDLLAGRHVDLGNSTGVVTRGNLDNPYLASGGASVRVVAGGKAPDYAGFVSFYRSYGSVKVATEAEVLALAQFLALPVSVKVGSAAGQAADYAYLLSLGTEAQNRFFGQLAQTLGFVTQAGSVPPLAQWPAAARTQLSSYLDNLGVRLGSEPLWAALRAAPATQQARFLAAQPALASRLEDSSARLASQLAATDTVALDAAFFASLVETGKLGQKDSTGKVIEASLKPFDALIASAFPGAASSAGGDISNFGSQFKTEQGGAIALYAPAGSVYAGLTLGFPGKLDSAQGIFTVRGGAINALVENDFLVNKGRVFTLGGGDIALVSQRADIDAGRGSKTAASAPPPVITVDPNGAVSVDVANSITGSGIATLKTSAEVLAGDVYAIAPRGVFDAGDAGVRSSGAVQVVATVVLNAGNINAAGPVVGAAVSVSAPSTAPVAAPSNTAAKDDEAAKAATNPSGSSSTLPLTVEALGYGCPPDTAASPDGECVASSDDTKKKKPPERK